MARSGLASVPLMMIPKKASRKNSKEVNCRAKADTMGVMVTMKSIPIRVPMQEAVVVAPIARPASPLQASG